jgi:hypothetical protein
MPERFRPGAERRQSRKAEQALQRRLEIGSPAAGNVEALAPQRHEAETEPVRDRTDGKPAIGLTIRNHASNITLGQRDGRHGIDVA